MKTSELIGPALDWAVAQAADYLRAGSSGYGVVIPGVLPVVVLPMRAWKPSERWAQGGPIMEREKITVVFRIMRDGSTNYWATTEPNDLRTDYEPVGFDAPTPLIAAMRCYVQSRLGDEVEIPEELL